ncbi:hypothetical protein PR048_022340 [Dryococelus australis]|uniref:Uncharacterized protein n=1 Tax=Dryococelus australis TaxID=614101 RepID=A0ABQ9H0Z4_9NEOP|nr:hypothetical protein PR048_022340 [Dryococelus australis]
MEKRRCERAGEMGDHRENPQNNGIVRLDSHMLHEMKIPGILRGWRCLCMRLLPDLAMFAKEAKEREHTTASRRCKKTTSQINFETSTHPRDPETNELLKAERLRCIFRVGWSCASKVKKRGSNTNTRA